MKVDLLNASKEDIRLELIPLIDVIFCVLTFFILAAVGLTRQQAISLDLPSAQTGQPLPGQVGQGGIGDRLYVSVDNLGQVYLDQQPVDLTLLYDVLLQFNQVNPAGLIVLYASRDARYEDVVTVLDVLRSVGGDRVALATLPRDLNLTNPTGDLPESEPGFPAGNPRGSDFEPTQPWLPNDSSSPLNQPGSSRLTAPQGDLPTDFPQEFADPNRPDAPNQP